ncbi:uncharacterized protein LOC121426219 isoform X3 [Lytechinus variegatus]|uniref:uncharacterized protein LOC121426219 isoform X3 n=1 Tax=Lytechinus variegatus TaxID=7654 RepID=UPI001BB1068F|nr:uncharacterized protein LOC121426219 isoform X3 [Lytechinus variegatus]
MSNYSRFSRSSVQHVFFPPLSRPVFHLNFAAKLSSSGCCLHNDVPKCCTVIGQLRLKSTDSVESTVSDHPKQLTRNRDVIDLVESVDSVESTFVNHKSESVDFGSGKIRGFCRIHLCEFRPLGSKYRLLSVCHKPWEHMTHNSSTVYHSEDEQESVQILEGIAESGSTLAVLQDPVTCFANARYKQTQSFDVSEDSNLILMDWLTAGRIARGECWNFTRCQARPEYHSGRQSYRENHQS